MRARLCAAHRIRIVQGAALALTICIMLSSWSAAAVAAGPAPAAFESVGQVSRRALTGVLDWVDPVAPRLLTRGPLGIALVSGAGPAGRVDDHPARALLGAPAERGKLPGTGEGPGWRPDRDGSE